MTIARWNGAQDLGNTQIDEAAGKMTEKAIAALGGMKRFVKNGEVVWIKPNIGWDRKPEQAGNTNPQIVATLVRLCLDAGAKAVKVGDNPVDPGQVDLCEQRHLRCRRGCGGQDRLPGPEPFPPEGHPGGTESRGCPYLPRNPGL